MQLKKHASQGFTLTLKPRADINRSPNQGDQWLHENDGCPPIFFKSDGSSLLLLFGDPLLPESAYGLNLISLLQTFTLPN